MRAVGAGGQRRQDDMYDASGTITAGGTAQLVLAQAPSRSFLLLQVEGPDSLWFEFGSGRATASLTSGAVSSCGVTNAGMGFSYTPSIVFEGGGALNNGLYLGVGQPEALSPSRPAVAHCVMTGSAPNMTIASIAIDDGGAGYVCPPYVYIRNNPNDPNGAAVPGNASAGSIFVPAGNFPMIWNGTVCPTSQISVFGAVTGTKYTVKWMT